MALSKTPAGQRSRPARPAQTAEAARSVHPAPLAPPAPITPQPRRSSRRLNYVDLTLPECQTLLESRDIGRIAWNAGGGPQILPVSYACVGELLVFRTSPFGVLSELVRPTQVVFEVDELDAARHAGWSVIVHGRAQAVASPALLTHLWTVEGAEPWAGGVRNVFIGITVERMTGRSFGLPRTPVNAR
ncbi:pyridoxamine 5'-phosphate oxidase family protein [Terrabacter sp. NPDC080008]|uniref:pyridoxamine 5'-phosphate oxidase family protein n=1 Tax=Terrabacter sp. NPDC080008 TaxID=3155176 RepID=UPI00344B079F